MSDRSAATKEDAFANKRQRAKRLAVVQSNYIPWKGYFDLINAVDEFVLYDDVQYTRRDWRNRNRIKTPHGLRWLTIPVNVSGHYLAPIKSITIADSRWHVRHFAALRAAYAAAPFFELYEPVLKELYLESCDAHLTAINTRFLRALCGVLGICTRISHSMDYELVGSRNERLVGICRQAGATAYVSGPSARSYVDADLFREAGMEVSFFDYSGYPEYPQLYPPFEHHVSILDLILTAGPEAPRYLLTQGMRTGSAEEDSAAPHDKSPSAVADGAQSKP